MRPLSTTSETGAADGTVSHLTAKPGLFAKIGNPAALVWLVPCTIAALYLSIFVARIPHNIWVLGWNSDYASGFTVPATVAKTGTGGHTVLGPYTLYVPLLFGLLTAWLPLHRELWEIAPTILFIASALIIGWSVAQVASRRAAVLAVLIVIVASPVVLSVFMAAVAHNTVYPCTALLGAYLIWLTRGDGRGRVTVFAVPLLAAVALGACIASDVLLVVTGLVPFALTALLACLRSDRRSRRVALSALTTALVALPAAKLTSALMSSLGYRTNPLALGLAPLSTLSLHARILYEGLKELFNGYLGSAGATGPLHVQLGVACDIVMIAALLTLLFVGARAASSLILRGRRAAPAVTPEQLATSLHITYWVSSALAACGAFLLSEFLDSTHISFYATVIFSVAAVVPLFVRSSFLARWLIPVGASIFFAASLVGLTTVEVGSLVPLAHYEPVIVRLARVNKVTAGYAGYWDASSLTWSSNERVAVRPVDECPNPGGANICIFPQETVPSWYVPKRRHSFLLVDRTPFALTSLPAGLGRPLAAYSFGPIRMYVYPYDIASRFGA